MHAVRRHLQRLTWIALLAIFGLALAPSVSHALHAGDASNPFAEICSAVSAKAVPGTPSGAPAGMVHLPHCPLCGPSSSVLGMPPTAVVVVVPAVSLATVATAVAGAAPSSRGRTLTQPRAPPSFS